MKALRIKDFKFDQDNSCRRFDRLVRHLDTIGVNMDEGCLMMIFASRCSDHRDLKTRRKHNLYTWNHSIIIMTSRLHADPCSSPKPPNLTRNVTKIFLLPQEGHTEDKCYNNHPELRPISKKSLKKDHTEAELPQTNANNEITFKYDAK